jgi:hypothetical protein
VGGTERVRKTSLSAWSRVKLQHLSERLDSLLKKLFFAPPALQGLKPDLYYQVRGTTEELAEKCVCGSRSSAGAKAQLN